MKKLRISHILVQPILVWDDGDELTDGPQIQPIKVYLSGLAGLVEGIPVEIKKIEEQFNKDIETTETTTD